MSPIGSVSNVQSILGTVLQKAGLNPSQYSTTSTSNGSSVSGDSSQLSPFAQLMSSLQQLQQSNPTRYQQVTSQIATDLQSAAQTAQSQGNTTAANQLNHLASAIGGHHHHHHAHAATGDSNGSSPTQLPSMLATNTDQSDPLNPLSIIENTLSNAGITPTNG